MLEVSRGPGTDVLVAGSGAAGLVAALTCAEAGLRVTVLERAAQFGGTTALSGGRVWVPGNPWTADPETDRRDAARYLLHVFGREHPGMIEAFLEAAPSMVRLVQRLTRHRFVPCPRYPDYHPGVDGASDGGRCLDAEPLPMTGQASLLESIREPHGYLPITHAEWERWRRPDRYDWDLVRRRQNEHVVTSGVGLIAALLEGALSMGVQVRTGARVSDVSVGGPGDFRVQVQESGTTTSVMQARSVVLACGGYDQDPELAAEYLPAGVSASAAPPGNTGDALRIARRLGGHVLNLDQGWWMPMIAIPGETLDGTRAYRSLVRERSVPRLILVNRRGRRFVNEATPYHELVKVMTAEDADGRLPNSPAFLVFDEGFRRRYPLPGVSPAGPAPSWLVVDGNLTGLARRLDIDASGLEGQVRSWNRMCAAGVDDEFGKGGNAFDRYHGDPEVTTAPNLGPLDEPPFYAARLLAGTIGSKGGPVTDVDARLVREGSVVEGLHVVGNAGAFWTSDGYPGPGATLGVGMAFGYRAGVAIATALRSDVAHLTGEHA